MAVAADQLKSTNDPTPDSYEGLFAFWQSFDFPEGYRAEIAEGTIRMNPPPGFPHNLTASLIHATLVKSAPDGVVVLQTQGLEIENDAKVYVPDLLAVAREAGDGRDLTLLSARTLLAVEVTSRSNARVDRQEKLVAYAHGRTPAYLLVDRARKNPTVTLYTDPVDGEYQHVVTVPFGDVLHLPEPFDVDLDTSLFPR